MTRVAISVGLVVLAALLQTSIVERFDIGGTSPDLLVLTVVSLALLTNSVEGAAYGFLAGVFLPIFTVLPLGPHALIGALLGYAVGRWGEVAITDEHPVPPLIAGVVGTLTMEIGLPLIEFLVASQPMTGIWSHALVSTVCGALLITPVYVAIRRLLGGSLAGDAVVGA